MRHEMNPETSHFVTIELVSPISRSGEENTFCGFLLCGLPYTLPLLSHAFLFSPNILGGKRPDIIIYI